MFGIIFPYERKKSACNLFFPGRKTGLLPKIFGIIFDIIHQQGKVMPDHLITIIDRMLKIVEISKFLYIKCQSFVEVLLATNNIRGIIGKVL
ncbi:hypothetical protein D3C73_1530760 [compost metagenome]